jgi:hypothetical protein
VLVEQAGPGDQLVPPVLRVQVVQEALPVQLDQVELVVVAPEVRDTITEATPHAILVILPINVGAYLLFTVELVAAAEELL